MWMDMMNILKKYWLHKKLTCEKGLRIMISASVKSIWIKFIIITRVETIPCTSGQAKNYYLMCFKYVCDFTFSLIRIKKYIIYDHPGTRTIDIDYIWIRLRLI